MDQKHSMLYPSLSGRPGEASSTTSHRSTEPTEAPPSYDMAMGNSAVVPSTEVQSPPQHPVAISAALHSHNNINPNPIQHPVSVEEPEAESLKLGPRPSKILCPECGERRRTRMHFTANRKTHIFAVILCLIGWCCCACTVPYCMRSCKTGHHYCAKCNRFLGSYDRNGY